MTHIERLLGALYVSEGWYASWQNRPRRIAFKARAMVVYDRIICNEEWRFKP